MLKHSVLRQYLVLCFERSYMFYILLINIKKVLFKKNLQLTVRWVMVFEILKSSVFDNYLLPWVYNNEWDEDIIRNHIFMTTFQITCNSSLLRNLIIRTIRFHWCLPIAEYASIINFNFRKNAKSISCLKPW